MATPWCAEQTVDQRRVAVSTVESNLSTTSRLKVATRGRFMVAEEGDFLRSVKGDMWAELSGVVVVL